MPHILLTLRVKLDRTYTRGKMGAPGAQIEHRGTTTKWALQSQGVNSRRWTQGATLPQEC